MVTTPAKVARNLTRSFFEMGHKRCNSSDHISMSEICARELRATLLGNQPDWKPTRKTAAWVHWYNTRRPHLALGGITPQQAENQHTTTRKEAASTSHHKTRDLTNNARATAPVTRRCTRSEGVSCLRIGCTAAHDKHNCGQFLPTHPSGSIRRSHTTSKYPPGSEQEALHPFRRATPDQKGCHAYGSGAPPPTTNTPRT